MAVLAFFDAGSRKCDFRLPYVFNDLPSLKTAVLPRTAYRLSKNAVFRQLADTNIASRILCTGVSNDRHGIVRSFQWRIDSGRVSRPYRARMLPPKGDSVTNPQVVKSLTDQDPYSEGFHEASEMLRMTVALLSQHRIPPSPFNYRIFYDIASGRDEGLRREVESYLENDGIEPWKLWELYRKYYQQDEGVLEEMRKELLRIISSMRTEFSRSGCRLTEYIERLERFSAILRSPPPEEEMVREVKEVYRETQSTEDAQRHLSEQMDAIFQEVEALRRELEQVKEESMTDALTGVCNRRAFDVTLEHAILEAREQQRPLTLLLVDIDHFKQFNDTYGHLVGDKVLRFVASTLKRSVKGKDTAARFGGEEFAVILPETDLKGAETVAEQVRTAISSGRLKDSSSGESYGTITTSIGVAQFKASDLPSDLLLRADRALYLAKSRGRNRVEKVI